MSNVNGGVYGITTSVQGIGTSTMIGFSAASHVMYSEIKNTSAAGIIFVVGSSVGVASAVTGGFPLGLTAAAQSFKIWGPAGFWLAATGASAQVSVVRGLSPNFAGSGASMTP